MMTSKGPTGPLFKWFGSKWTAAKKYPSPEPHAFLFEPYAGSAGYSLRHWDRVVTLYDTNPHLQILWPWLIAEATNTAVREIPVGIPEGTDIRSLGLSEGQAELLRCWQRTNNTGDCWTVSSWGHLPGQWTENTRARVADEIQYVKHWTFERINYGVVGTYFIDPPYQYNYKYGSPEVDYSWLGMQIQALEIAGCQVIACEAVCPKTGSVPSWLPFQPFGSFVTSRRKAHNNHHSKELMYHAIG